MALILFLVFRRVHLDVGNGVSCLSFLVASRLISRLVIM
jgi:predicted amidohydrolase